MATAYTSLLGLALPVTGELTGTWGTTVNDYITQYLDAAVAGAQVISGNQTAVTLSTTNGSSLVQAGGAGVTGSAQYSIIRCTGNPASLLTITAPTASKVYLIINATSTSQSVKIVASGPTTGVTVASGRAALVAWNGSDYALVATTDITALSGTLTVAKGGTGQTSFTDGQLLIGNSSGNTLTKATLTAGSNVTITNGNGSITIASSNPGGTVTSVAVSGGTTGLTTSGGPITGSGTITLAGTLAVANGGTGQTSATEAFDALAPTTTLGDTIYRGASDNLRLAGNITAVKNFLSQTGNGTVSAAPAWSTVTKSDVGLSNVENTALSTWAGSSNITTVGTLSSLTASGAVSFSTSTDNLNLGTSQTTGTTTIGGASQTGAITIGQATGNQTVNIATGTLVAAATKTLNIGTGGTTGNTTQINVGNLTSRVDVAGKLSINNTGATTADFYVFGSSSLGTTTVRGNFTGEALINGFGPQTGTSTGTTTLDLRGMTSWPTISSTRFAHIPGTGLYNSDFQIQEQTNISTFTTRIWLLSGGNFGIGVSPSYKLDVNGTARFSGGAATPPVAVTFSATAMTVNCSLSNVFTTTFTANVTTAPTLSNPQDGQTINWFITQDATGSRTMTWPTSFKWPGGTAGVLSTAANAVDLVTATYRSATGFWYATLLKAFS